MTVEVAVLGKLQALVYDILPCVRKMPENGAPECASWAVRPNEPSGFRGRKAILNHASALFLACP